MTTLYLVGHGETVDNVAQILQGQTQGQLNEKGIEQAKEVCEKMKDCDIDVFLSSDLKRAYDTCCIIAAPHHKDVEKVPLIRERDWGDFTGKFIPDMKDAKWPDNVETLEKMLSRARNFLTYIKVTYPDKKVLAVGHGLINKAIQSVFNGKPMNEIPKMGNAEVRIIML